MYDTIVIGAGTAGLTAAIYLRRAGKSVLVLEGDSYGGQIINTSSIENYPALYKISGYDYATNLYNQVIDLGAVVSFEAAVKIEDGDIKKVTTKDTTYESKTIIIATGASNRKLSINGEDDFIGKGVSYCATCDGNFYKDKNVAVVGGGNTALQDAIYLSDMCNKVYLIHRRDEFRGDFNEVKTAESKNNIEFILNSNVVKLNGTDHLESIVVKDNEENEKELEVAGLFVAIGQVPANVLFKDMIDLDKQGYIISEDCTTKVPGIFVAGDNRTKKLRQLVTAASDGAIAAVEAINYMR